MVADWMFACSREDQPTLSVIGNRPGRDRESLPDAVTPPIRKGQT